MIGKGFCFSCQLLLLFRILSASPNCSFSVRALASPPATAAGTSQLVHPIILYSLPPFAAVFLLIYISVSAVDELCAHSLLPIAPFSVSISPLQKWSAVLFFSPNDQRSFSLFSLFFVARWGNGYTCPPPSYISSRLLVFPPLVNVCSGEAVVSGWRRTWWPRQEMLQQGEIGGARSGIAPLCTFFLIVSHSFPVLHMFSLSPPCAFKKIFSSSQLRSSVFQRLTFFSLNPLFHTTAFPYFFPCCCEWFRYWGRPFKRHMLFPPCSCKLQLSSWNAAKKCSDIFTTTTKVIVLLPQGKRAQLNCSLITLQISSDMEQLSKFIESINSSCKTVRVQRDS